MVENESTELKSVKQKTGVNITTSETETIGQPSLKFRGQIEANSEMMESLRRTIEIEMERKLSTRIEGLKKSLKDELGLEMIGSNWQPFGTLLGGSSYPPTLDQTFSLVEPTTESPFKLQEIEDKYRKLEKEIQDLKSKQDKPNNFQIQQSIIEHNKYFLNQNHKGEFVALTYEGKVIASSSVKVDVIKKVKSSKIPLNQVFIYGVPLN